MNYSVTSPNDDPEATALWISTLARVLLNRATDADIDLVNRCFLVAAWFSHAHGRKKTTIRFLTANTLFRNSSSSAYADAAAVAAFDASIILEELDEGWEARFAAEEDAFFDSLERLAEDSEDVLKRSRLGMSAYILGSTGLSPAFDRDYAAARKGAAQLCAYEGSKGIKHAVPFIFTAAAAVKLFGIDLYPETEFTIPAGQSALFLEGRALPVSGDFGLLYAVFKAARVLSKLSARDYRTAVTAGADELRRAVRTVRQGAC